jgi:glutathione S-transferase
VKSVKDPQDKIEAEFVKAQEAARKDIERAFGVLEARFARTCLVLGQKTLVNMMTCCVIFHNMIIEDERGLNLPISMTM